MLLQVAADISQQLPVFGFSCQYTMRVARLQIIQVVITLLLQGVYSRTLSYSVWPIKADSVLVVLINRGSPSINQT